MTDEDRMIPNNTKSSSIMAVDHKKILQANYSNLVDSIANVDGVIDGLFSQFIFTMAKKNQIVEEHRVKENRIRQVLDHLFRRDPKDFQIFCEVLRQKEEFCALKYLLPEFKEQQDFQQHPDTNPVTSDCVPPHASILQHQDEELPRFWPNINKHNPNVITVVKVPETNTYMKSLFNQSAKGNSMIYPMGHRERGVAVIFNNESFEEGNLAPRVGSDVDVISCDQLFVQLGFRTKIFTNCTSKEMVQHLREETARDHKEHDCFVCYISSHGDQDAVFGVDGRTISINEILECADGNNAPSLICKPKLFFIEASQGSMMDKGIQVSKTDNSREVMGLNLSDMDVHSAGPPKANEMKEMKNIVREPKDMTGNKETIPSQELMPETGDIPRIYSISSKADIFVAFAAVSGYFSFRNIKNGCWFTQAVVYVLSHLSNEYDLSSLMTRVNNLVGRGEGYRGGKQMPVYKSTLTKDFYFFPGLSIL